MKPEANITIQLDPDDVERLEDAIEHAKVRCWWQGFACGWLSAALGAVASWVLA